MNGLANLDKDVIEAAARAYHRGIQTGNGGNLSARVPDKDQMVVKPSGVSFIECTESNLVVTDFDGKLVAGNGKPSREALLHGAIYRALPQVGGVVHCHAPWAISWSLLKKDLPLVTKHAQMKIGMSIPVLDVEAPVVPVEEMPGITKLLGDHPELPAFILAGHGIVAIGKNVLAAEHMAELIEESAQIAWLFEVEKKLIAS